MMNEIPYLRPKPTRHTPAASLPNRHSLPDDILLHLGPNTAADALASSTGPLRKCLDDATVSENEFALRTALVARRIWEWVEELQGWPWPAEGGPEGFEPPSGARRKALAYANNADGEGSDYMGSLPVEAVTRYEMRIDQIQQDLELLNVEEIKSHVLSNHILPLSRPGTPLSDTASLYSNYNKMDDLTAVVTAIVIQTLPALARLSRQLQVWGIRLNVLKRIPSLLLDIEDAEVALKSGWNVISKPSTGTELEAVLEEEEEGVQGGTPFYESTSLSRKDFDVMKLVLEKKTTEPGRTLDHLLDCLEGLRDTLPEEWLDRMEAVETGFAEWVLACEKKMEADRARANRPCSPIKKSIEHDDTHMEDIAEDPAEDIHDTSIVSQASTAATVIQGSPSEDSSSRSSPGLGDPISFDKTRESKIPRPCIQPPTPTNENGDFGMTRGRTPKTPDVRYDYESDIILETPDNYGRDDEPGLPTLRTYRRRSSVGYHDNSSPFGGMMSGEMPDMNISPNLPTGRIREAEYLQASPPSSPPMSIDGAYDSGMTPFDSPMMPDDDDFMPCTPPHRSLMEEYDDDAIFVTEAQGANRRESAGDQHLRQQISRIISSIPTKIKLSTEHPSVNLNPPDIQLPRMRRRASAEPFKRSTSAISSRANSRANSRAGTPSFTLSPAQPTRQYRRRAGQQEIKVYHLSRPNGEAPIKLFIRCVGENGERVMVRVGGGWADLGEYLKEYANHHKRRSAALRDATVELGEKSRRPSTSHVGSRRPSTSNIGSSPPARPASALEISPPSPLAVRKTRRSSGAMNHEPPRLRAASGGAPPVSGRPVTQDGPSSGESIPSRSRSSSHVSWHEDDNTLLGLAGPTGKKVEMSENRAWVESVKEKVRLASGDLMAPGQEEKNRFGDLGRIGGTQRVFRKPEERRASSRNSSRR